MSDPLYNKDVLRLAADATGAGRLAEPDASATLHNPACGDKVTMDVAVKDGYITDLAHQTKACVLAQASASLLAAQGPGRTPEEIAALAEDLRVLLQGGEAPPAPFDGYGVFNGLTDFKGRHRCVLLPVEAALAALKVSQPGKPGA